MELHYTATMMLLLSDTLEQTLLHQHANNLNQLNSAPLLIILINHQTSYLQSVQFSASPEWYEYKADHSEYLSVPWYLMR